MTPSFAPLHVHTEYSALDGATRAGDLMRRVAELGMPAVAMTDHGNMFGAYEFWQAAKDAGVKPVLGIEAYMAPGSRLDKRATFWGHPGQRDDDVSGKGAYTHLTLLAVSATGLRNLFRLSSLASIEGHYRKPRMDYELLAEYAEGIVAATGCPGGEVQTRLRLGQFREALEAAARLRDIFGAGNVFLELMDHGLAVERRVREDLLDIGRQLGLPPLATNDSHYTLPEDAELHDALLCVGTGAKLADTNRFRFEGSGYYVRSAEEMRALWDTEVPGACDNTLLVAERVESYDEVFAARDLMPAADVPEGHTSTSWLRAEAERGAQERYADPLPPEVADRLGRELDVITRMGLEDYFLVVADICRHARERGIRMSPGRGCLTGSVLVRTGAGVTPLKDVTVGDEVLTHANRWRRVINTHKYNVDEPLVRVRAYYDDASGVTMTRDHKVLVEKGRCLSGRKKERRNIWLEPAGRVEWVAAANVEVGDLVVTPREDVRVENREYVDLADYVDHTCQIEGDRIVEFGSGNESFAYSIRDVHQVTQVSRGAVQALVGGGKSSQPRTHARVMEYVGKEFASISDWRRYLIARRARRSQPRFVVVDNNFCFFMGMLISNGWLRRSDLSEVGVAVRRTKGDPLPIELFHKVLGVVPKRYDHASKDVTQYRIASRPFRMFLAAEWVGYNFHAQSKTIPEWMVRLPEEKRWALLEGLWWGDGSHGSKTTYSTSSRRLKDQVRSLLWGLGLPAGVRRECRSDEREGWEAVDRESWAITTTRHFGPIANQHGWRDDKYLYSRVYRTEERPAEKVYDITVEQDASYTTSSFVVHNSGAGSIVCYSLRITHLDPLAHDLHFERFVNPERVSMPDIDLDFDERRRDEMLAYVTDKYGRDHVAQILTLQRGKDRGSRAAVRDAARVLGLPYELGERVCRSLPAVSMGKDVPLVAGLEGTHKRSSEMHAVRELCDQDPDAGKVVDLARRLEGIVRGIGVHPAGVVISSAPLIDVLPLHVRPADGAVIAGFPMEQVEALGLLKMDFLGLRNLTVIEDTVRHVECRTGTEIDLDVIPPDDPAVYATLAAGDNDGVFQLESAGIRALCRQMKVGEFADLVAIGALYRPGPMSAGMHTEYAKRKHGLSPASLPHSDLEEALGPTYGILVYQEQVLEVVKRIAGFSGSQADLLRRAVGKKKPAEMAAQKSKFLDGCAANGYSQALGHELWRLIEGFSDYGFCKAHAAAYAMVGYHTAWLKAHYPVEFMGALLSSVKGDKDRLAGYLGTCRALRIPVLPPCVNASDVDFSPVSAQIRFGLSAIRNVGERDAELIREARGEPFDRGMPFADFRDFADRVDRSVLNKRTVESLIKAGAFDSLGHSRKGLLEVFEGLCEQAAAANRKRSYGESSLFDAADDLELFVIPEGEFDQKELLTLEREMLGTYVSAHPLFGLEEALAQVSSVSVAQLREMDLGGRVTIAGLLANLVVKRTRKRGEPFAVAVLEDLTGSVEVVVFPTVYAQAVDLLADNAILVVTGRLDDGDALKVIAAEVRPLDPDEPLPVEVPVPVPPSVPIVLCLTARQCTDEFVGRLRDMLASHPGDTPVHVALEGVERTVTLVVSDKLRVQPSASLDAALEALLGTREHVWEAS